MCSSDLPEDTRTAGAWIAGVQPCDYSSATAGAWQLGEWVADSVKRHAGIDAIAHGSHLFSAHLAAAALERLVTDLNPSEIFVVETASALSATAAGIARLRGFAVRVGS